MVCFILSSITIRPHPLLDNLQQEIRMVRSFSVLLLIVAHWLCSETCIKGHRSSSCKHSDRPLFEIKKKGRPVTQCEHCRELRKTKQVHVKCLCESKSTEFPSQGVLIHATCKDVSYAHR